LDEVYFIFKAAYIKFILDIEEKFYFHLNKMLADFPFNEFIFKTI